MQKVKRIVDKKYLEWIKRLPCLLCQCPSEPHHIPKENDAALGKKTDDTRAIPLCHMHHMIYHNKGRQTFKEEYKMDYEYVISELNRIWRERCHAMKSM